MSVIFSIMSVLAGLAIAAELQSTVAPLFRPAGEIIPGRYIVKLKSDGHLRTASDSVLKHVAAAEHVYSNMFPGFAASLDKAELAFLRLSPSVRTFTDSKARWLFFLTDSTQVEYIEHDMTVKPFSYIDQPNAGWNLGRISHRLPGHNTYTYDSSAGAGTCSYILDTGIAADHTV